MKRAVQRLSTWAITVSVTTGISAQVHTPMDGLWIPNGPVHAIARDANNVYVGGYFSEVNACLPFGVALAHGTGNPFSLHAKPSGAVNAVIPDGSGGWYIGGEFGVVGTEVRTNVARINADGTLNPWQCTDNIFPAVTYALQLAGDTLFVGTTFGLVAIDLNTGVRIPSVSYISLGPVYCLAKAGNILYFGGQFDNVDGYARTNAAAINLSSGFVTLWDPQAAGPGVRALAVDGNTIYVTGEFNFLGGQARQGLGSVDNIFGLATPWAPGAAGGFALTVNSGRLFIGGSFNTLDGQTRHGLASFDLSTGALDAWAPDLQEVHAISILGNTLFAGGEFQVVNGEPHVRVVSVDMGTGQVVPWSPMEMNASVNAICAQPDGVYVGGQFTTMGHVARNNIAAFDAGTGQPTAWDPGADGEVWTLDVVNGTVLAGGSFVNIGGQNRANLAAIDASTGVTTSWDPAVNGVVHRSLLVGNTLYLSGYFSSVGGQQRVLAGAIDINTALATPWNPLPNEEIKAFADGGDVIWVGGTFQHFNGVVRQSVAALDPITGVPNAWERTDLGNVNALLASNNAIYVGGWFQTSWPDVRQNLAAFDATTTEALPFNPWTSNEVRSMALVNNTLYIGGDFFEVGPNMAVYRDHFAAVDAASGAVLDWEAPVDAPVKVMLAFGNALYLGGDFAHVGYQTKRALAGYRVDFSTNMGGEPVPKVSHELHSWPNPSNGTCFIELDDNFKGATVQVFNAIGERIMTLGPTGTGIVRMEWCAPSGVYLIQATSPDGERRTARVLTR